MQMFMIGAFLGAAVGAILMAVIASGSDSLTDCATEYKRGYSDGVIAERAHAHALKSAAGKKSAATRKAKARPVE